MYPSIFSPHRMLFCLTLLLIPAWLLAQNEQPEPEEIKQDSFIEQFAPYLSLKLSANNNIEVFSVQSDPLSFTISPNYAMKTKLAVNYQFISFALGVSPAFLPGNGDEDRRGESQITTIDAELLFDHWLQRLSFHRAQGFYLRNTEEFIPGWDADADPYLQFSDMWYTSVSGQTGYVFNEDLSIKALRTQTERQLKSAGSFIPLLGYRYYTLDDRRELSGQGSTQRSNNMEGVLQVGYTHTFVHRKKYYLSFSAALGGGFIHSVLFTRFPEQEFRTQATHPLLQTQGELALGYNGARFFSGLQVRGRYENYEQNDATRTAVEGLVYQVFVGYRFNAPAFLKRLIN